MNELHALVRFVAESRLARIAEPVQDEATRGLVDWLGCCLGGCLDPAVDVIEGAIAAPDALQATLPGRGSRGAVTAVAQSSAIAAAVLDFAPAYGAENASMSVPIAAALLPLAEARGSSGAELLHAYVLGSEIACRLAQAPQGGEDGSRETFALCGAIGAAAGCGKLIGLDAAALRDALGMAAMPRAALDIASASAFLPVAFAAGQGLRAALLAGGEAARNPGARDAAQDAAASAVAARLRDSGPILDGLGEEWQLACLAYKPYPCDGMLHGAIEACLSMRIRMRLLARQIATVRLWLHPAVLARVNEPAPRDRAQAQHSIQHAAAVTLVDGAAGIEQFAERRVASARVAGMRARVEARADASVPLEGARVVVHLIDGRSAEHTVRCARGTPARPLTDAELSDKFRDLAAEVLATDQAERALALAWNVRALGDVGALVRAAVPEDAVEPSELPGSPLIPR